MKSVIGSRGKTFRELDDSFMEELRDGKLMPILRFERRHRSSFTVEIRKNFLNLYFLGHGLDVKRAFGTYFLRASNRFNPESRLRPELKKIVTEISRNRWQISFDDIAQESPNAFDEIMTAVISKIVEFKKGDISEGVSEINHMLDNREIGKNGILVIDRQVVYPGRSEDRMDLLGLKRLDRNYFTFVVLELKNKYNRDIANVFTDQVKRYVDLVYDQYDDFSETYERVLSQKIDLGLLNPIDCKIAPKNRICKKDIVGVAVLDNYDIKRDLKDDGLLLSALEDWKMLGDEYNAKLFLKTNVLDSTFFMDRQKSADLLETYRSTN